MKILVVEDDRPVAKALELLLSRYNYAVDLAADGSTSLQLVESFEYNLIVLDVILPDLDGISICQRLRAAGEQMPILLLTGQGGAEQKAIALNAGADDYVVKPFDSGELIARIQALLRRGNPTAQPILSWGNLSVDPSSRSVTYGAYLLSVTPKEYALLEVFLRNPQKVLSAKTILDQVWNSVESPGEEAVRVHIKELRHKLRTAGAPKDFIKTVYRVGYQLNPLYSDILVAQVEQQPTVPNIAELKSANQELRAVLEQLRATQEELRQKNQELEIAYQTIAQERQQLQAAHDELELRVAQRTAELVQANHHLQEKEARLQRLTANGVGMIYQYVLRADGSEGFTYVSPRCREIYELEPAELCQNFGQIWAMIHPEDVDRLRQANRDSAQQLTRLDVEFRLLPASGCLRWVRAVAQPERQANGDVVWDGIVLDITVQKANEQALRNSEQTYHQILDAIADMVVVKQPDSRLVWANQAFRDYYGMTLEELQGILDAPFNQPDYTQQYLRDDAFVFATGQTLKIPEEPITRHDDVVRLFSTVKAPVFDENDQVALLVGVCRDITDRKQAEIDLQEREAFLTGIYEGSNQAIFVIDVAANDFHYVSFNSLAERYAGLRSQDIQGKTPEEAFGPIVGASFRQHYAGCLQAGTSIFYEEQVGLETHSIWTLTTLSPLRDEAGNIFRIVGTAIDITDRKQLELAQQEAQILVQNREEQLRLSLDLNQIGMWECQLQKGIVTWSDSTYRLLGYEPGEVEPGYKFWLSRVYPGDLAAVEQHIGQAIATQTVFADEYRVVLPDGSISWRLSKGRGVYDESGQPVRMVGITLDVSDRKQAELELQQREELLRSIYDGAAQAIFVVEVSETQDFHFLSFNHLAEQLAGRTNQELQGKTPEEVFGASLGARLRHNYERCLQLNSTLSYEEHVVFENRTFWVLTTLAPLRNEQGRIHRIVGTSTDISERKQLEQALQASEAKLSRILDRAIAAISSFRVYADRNWEYEYWSAGCERLFGYPLEAYSDKHFWLSQVVPEDRNQLLSLFDYFFAEQDVTVEYRFRRKDGVIRWFSSSYTAQKIADDGWVVTAVNHDITERKLADQKIQEQAALLDIASDAIFVRDLDHHLLYWNKGAERLYGWSATAAIGQPVNELLQEAPSQIWQCMQMLYERGEWQGELRKITQAAEEVIVEARWTLVRNEAGEPKFILSVETDITGKKQLETQFYRAQRLESLGTLAGGIAHDLNNVLTPILTIAQLMRLQQPTDNGYSQEMLEILEDSAKRGANMVKQILTFTRGTDGQRSPLQVASVVQEVINVMRQTFPKSISIRQALSEPSLGLVTADPTHLHQVFMNLCVNARDAMPDGGTLTISAENYYADEIFAQMNLNAQVGNYVLVTISDTGTGIPAEFRDRIFDPFFTTKAPGLGTGLGLSSSLGIVKSYGGFLQVVSEVGVGTEVKVFLPATEGIPTESQTEAELLQGKGELVLIVDDDLAVQRINQSLLESNHYTTLVANDGIDALSLYASHQRSVKVILIDVMMPNMDGVTAVRTLRNINPSVKIIAISGLTSNREPVLAAGADVFLSKPYTLEDLLRTISDLVKSSG